ncbi:MAG: hypothetical protein MMC33_005866 [Icmadophila ericetorum]|nr:hypothetical protein [Icmadophila ericetorum]
MVVGLAIWTDTKFTRSKTLANAAQSILKAPVTLAVAVSTGVMLPSIDPEISGSSRSEVTKSMDGQNVGNSIFAIEYRAVRRRFYSLSDEFEPKLETYGPRVVGGMVLSRASEEAEIVKAEREQPQGWS